ncbi:hypothetical protein [Hamadaea tsunoensis]|uniref:hypothetical protein n=1 Tax=Hamadaea tsunoensis TaxID=53368 RepID=UPI0003FF50B6|nr:hypothetical protein [Hamadaea tsunoensis]
MRRSELEAWLGPALDELTRAQITALQREARIVAQRFPDVDDADLAEAALSAAVQYILGETTLESAGHARNLAKRAEQRAYAALQQVVIMEQRRTGISDVAASKASGADRGTIRKMTGKVRADRRPDLGTSTR